MFATQGARGFTEDMCRFLPIARRSPPNYVLVVLFVLAPVVALVGLRDDVTGAPFLVADLGLATWPRSRVRC
jgi:hypothetical protein